MRRISELGFAARGSDVVHSSKNTAERDASRRREFAFREGNFTAPANISEREVD
jgi:hypothetical protein